jgi:CHAT domain-containing protein
VASAEISGPRRLTAELHRLQKPATSCQIDAAELSRRIAAAEQAQAEADSALQAASPGYGQLVQQVVPTKTVLDALRPGEVFVSIVLGDTEGWTFALREGKVQTGHIDAGSAQIAALVKRIRATVELSSGDTLPTFDVGAAQELYTKMLGGVAARLEEAQSLTVAPTGPLLSMSFALLLEGQADPAALGQAPWLIRRMAVSHVPAPANFISLRKVAGTSRASNPWFGLGDFQPIPLGLAARTFPAGSCSDSARLLADLQRLPFAGRELDAARQLLGANVSNELTGRAYTAAAVQAANLNNYRVLHFASHALLPAELKCEDEPAIVTSAPSGAKDASGALLTADEIAALKLDAEVVILSACNSGGAAGGESLSGLARAFFFAGARSMLVTHWSVNDQTSAFLVADSLRRQKTQPAGGLAEALRQSQLALIDGPSGAAAHPYFWAAFALIGEGRTSSIVANPGTAGQGRILAANRP